MKQPVSLLIVCILLLLLLQFVSSVDILLQSTSSRTSKHATFQNKRFTVGSEYTPSHWRLVSRTSSKDVYGPNPLKSSPDDYFTFIPTYIGSVLPGQTLQWSSTCFQSCTASMTINGNSSLSLGVSTNDKKSYFCDEVYLIGYVGAFDLVTYLLPGVHSSTWNGGWPDEELWDLQTNGIRLFRFPDEVTGTSEEVFETMMLFFGALIGAKVPEWTAEDNLKFLQDHMNVVMEVRPTNRVDIPKTEFKNGDFLGIIRLDGLDPMLAWAMGAHTGHTTITWWIDNELYVLESTISSNYWPTNGIQKTPFDKWIEQAQAANYNVIHLPLDPTLSARLNTTAALEFFNSVQGLPYGFHNQFTGWIDTPQDNYPPPLHSEAVMLLASYAEWILAQEGDTLDYLAQTLNYRLGTKGLTINQAYMEAGKRGIDFIELITMPELDEWIFEDDNGVKGPSMVCDVFVTRMWKAGGLFSSDLVNSFSATEFTNWDAYSLKIFDNNYKRPQVCIDADPSSIFCQLLGQYRMSLPDYNTFVPYAHMRERCPSLPPKYVKPIGC